MVWNYSEIGRNLVEIFHLLFKKYEILSYKPKKLMAKNFFSIEEKKEKEGRYNRYTERKKIKILKK